jgi:hypothetical protein
LTEPRALRNAYQQEFEAFLQQIRRGCRDLHMEHQLLRTDAPLDVALSSFLAGRMQKM